MSWSQAGYHTGDPVLKLDWRCGAKEPVPRWIWGGSESVPIFQWCNTEQMVPEAVTNNRGTVTVSQFPGVPPGQVVPVPE